MVTTCSMWVASSHSHSPVHGPVKSPDFVPTPFQLFPIVSQAIMHANFQPRRRMLFVYKKGWSWSKLWRRRATMSPCLQWWERERERERQLELAEPRLLWHCEVSESMGYWDRVDTAEIVCSWQCKTKSHTDICDNRKYTNDNVNGR